MRTAASCCSLILTVWTADGETALIYFGGAFSPRFAKGHCCDAATARHAPCLRPKQITARVPRLDELRTGERALGAIPYATPLYRARGSYPRRRWRAARSRARAHGALTLLRARGGLSRALRGARPRISPEWWNLKCLESSFWYATAKASGTWRTSLQDGLDVDLSEQGYREAGAAGPLLLREKIAIDVAFTSLLKRAIRTLWIMLDEMDRMWIPVERSWRLKRAPLWCVAGTQIRRKPSTSMAKRRSRSGGAVTTSLRRRSTRMNKRPSAL